MLLDLFLCRTREDDADDDDRDALLVQLLEESHHFHGSAAVQVSRRLIGQQDGGMVDQRAVQWRVRLQSLDDELLECLARTSDRLRPILMTSFAMALGSLPIALSLGDAATSRQPLGIVIVGGILFSLILTLFVIPAMYTFLSRDRKHIEFGDEEPTTQPKTHKDLVYEA